MNQAPPLRDYKDPKQLVGGELDAFIVTQVLLFNGLKLGANAAPSPDEKPHQLHEYLPDDKWWLLYINPHDHKDAVVTKSEDPGTFYSKDKDPTFKEAMLASFKMFLEGDVVTFADKLDLALYRQMYFRSTINQGEDIGHPKYAPRQKGDVGSFTAAKTLGADIYGETICGKPMVKTMLKCQGVPNPNPWPSAESYIVLHSDCASGANPNPGTNPDYKFRTFADTKALEDILQQVFVDYHHGIQDAAASKGPDKWHRQLRAIARLIRNLHIIHGYKDGNGRTNLYIVLPLLLMRHGFGLPLGGNNFSTLDNNTMNDLFSGGYTVDQMADFLWLAQDFGLMAADKHQTDTILKHY
jgi:hypothetical protein